MRENLNRLGLLGLIAVITYGSLASGKSPVSAGGLPIHFAAYFVLAAAFFVNFHDTRKGHIESILAAGLIALGIEILQLFLPYRTFSVTDFAVSFAGASVITLDHHLGLVTRFISFEDRIIEQLMS